MQYIKHPRQIEDNSFIIIDDIIKQTHPDYQFVDRVQAAVIKRVIHTTADFEWLTLLHFTSDAIEQIQQGIRAGCTIYTDTTMAMSGINKRRLVEYGCECRCYVSDNDVAQHAKEAQITRSMAAVDKALTEEGEKIFVFGNAPTALFRLLEQSEKPRAVVGVPVGFVGAAESKEALVNSQLTGIASIGRKGGSNVAAAIINAIIYQMDKEA